MIFDPRQRGYSVLYHDGENTHCPGCGRSQWFVGRSTAECAFCMTALPRAEVVWDSRPTPVSAFISGLGGYEVQPLAT